MSDVTERHKRNAMFIQLFARLMVGEMAANAAKGDWIGMNFIELINELTHHTAKLVKDMACIDEMRHSPTKRPTLDYIEIQQFVCEHAADTANIAMFIAVIAGNMMGNYTPVHATPSTDSLSSLLIEAEQALALVAKMRERQSSPITTIKHQAIMNAAEELADSAVLGLLPRIRARLAGLLEQQSNARYAANFDDETNPENINVPSH